jgi:hypothetical protein
MPIRDKSAYPVNWHAIALAIKEAAGWRCESCGMQCRTPDEPFDTHRRTMSVAHLNHEPSDCAPSNLAAWCSACHLRFDAPMHARHAAATRRAKRIASGQTELGL